MMAISYDDNHRHHCLADNIKTFKKYSRTLFNIPPPTPPFIYFRVYDNATAIALMQQTKITLGIEDNLFKGTRRKYWKHIEENCSPLSLFYDDDVVKEQCDDLRKMTFHIQVKCTLITLIKDLKLKGFWQALYFLPLRDWPWVGL